LFSTRTPALLLVALIHPSAWKRVFSEVRRILKTVSQCILRLPRILSLKHYREGGDEVYANAINLRTLVIAAAVAMLVALGGAGIAYANGGDSEEQLTGPDAEKAKSAAIAAVGGGTVSEVERDDGNGTGAFEVEVTREDGSQLEVHLDGDLNVVGQEADEDGPNDHDGPNDD
jgi:uncharacterized membrane protein YkoI